MSADVDTSPLLLPTTAEPERTASGKYVRGQFKEAKRNLTTMRLMMMTYFLTCGGPFGIEPAVGAGGPLYTLIALIVIPIVWSLPQALMAAELSLMTSENGGNIVWVKRAFGDFISWINSFNNLACNFSSSALYIVIFVEYLPYDFSWWEALLLKAGFSALIGFLNIVGLTFISRLSVVFTILIVSPFFAQAIAAPVLGKFAIKKIVEILPFGDVKWGLFLSTAIWCYGGFDGVGTLAGEVKGGRSTYLKGLAGALVLAIANYLIPVLFGFAIYPHTHDWKSGFFTQVAYRLGTWCGVLIVAASIISNFGQYNANLAAISRVVWAMARGEGKEKQLPSILSWSWQRKSGTVRPVSAIIFTAALSGLLAIILPYNILVEIFLVVRTVNLGLTYAAFIRLRYKEKDTPRPFIVPGGNVGAVLMVIPSAALSIFNMVYTETSVLITGATINGAVILLFFLQKWLGGMCDKTKRKKEGYVQLPGEDVPAISSSSSNSSSISSYPYGHQDSFEDEKEKTIQ